jgi:hypothetical protein
MASGCGEHVKNGHSGIGGTARPLCAARPVTRRAEQRGAALIEFVVCFGLVWVPLFLGACQIGFQLIQAIQVTQVCRDSGHLYAYGIDFSQTSNQYLLASFAPNLQIDPTGAGGSSVVILSTVYYVGMADCLAGGYSSACPNYGLIVFTNQIAVGNASIHASGYGTPSTDSYGNVSRGSPSTPGYLNQGNAVVQSFPGITLSTGTTGQQTAYISEMYSQSMGFNWLYPGTQWVNSISFF